MVAVRVEEPAFSVAVTVTFVVAPEPEPVDGENVSQFAEDVAVQDVDVLATVTPSDVLTPSL